MSTMRSAILALFFLVNALDVLTTHIALAAGLSEGNPIPALLLRHGEWAMYGVKGGVCLALILLAVRLHWRLRWHAVCAVTALTALVVVSNISALI